MAHQQPPRPQERTDAERTNTESRPPARGVHLPADEAFAVLRNDRRRAVVTFLADEHGVRSVERVTRAVAASDHGVPPEHVTERQRKCTYVSLLQVHLPKLAEVGVIEWDEPGGTVEGARSIAALAGVIDLVEGVCADSDGR